VDRGDEAATTQPGEPATAPEVEGGMVILEPSQGRPLILAPGDSFYFMMDVPGGLSGTVPVRLVHSLVGRISYEAELGTPLSRAGPGRLVAAVLRIPKATVPGLYDLKLETPAGDFWARRSLRVVEFFKRQWRFVHLSDMNVGDLTAPDFD
jgi:hypothetical protein